jgi:hypothetical protein
MNQGIAFARTIRALEADDFRRSKTGFAVAAILLGAWAWWMVAARVPRYEGAAKVQIEAGRVIAQFPSTGQIRSGQSATVTVGGEAFPARVENVTADRAELVFTGRQPAATGSQSASAEIEIGRVSPAGIALRTLGRGRP